MWSWFRVIQFLLIQPSHRIIITCLIYIEVMLLFIHLPKTNSNLEEAKLIVDVVFIINVKVLIFGGVYQTKSGKLDLRDFETANWVLMERNSFLSNYLDLRTAVSRLIPVVSYVYLFAILLVSPQIKMSDYLEKNQLKCVSRR